MPSTDKSGMVRIRGGTFWMGTSDNRFPDAQPAHLVRLKSFWIDKTEVTNKEFKKFVDETKYVTVAERKPLAKDYPHVPESQLVPGALVFYPPQVRTKLRDPYTWWHYVPGAYWLHPEGPESNLDNRWDHPVVHVAWDDAVAYANWAGKRLPTEAEFEYAARGGLDRRKYSWGDELNPSNKHLANLWQGVFPMENSKQDGFVGTSPVKSFPANGYGLYDMTGNVWEWCVDWYRADYYLRLPQGKAVTNPWGPESSLDPREPGAAKKVQKGGSFLCTDQYCARYMVGSRGKSEYRTGLSNVGFRCVAD